MSFYAVYRASGVSACDIKAVWCILAADRRCFLGRIAGSGIDCVFYLCCLIRIPMTYNCLTMVFVIVLLSLAVQGTLLPVVSRKLEMIDKNANVMRTFNDYQDENDILLSRSRSLTIIRLQEKH